MILLMLDVLAAWKWLLSKLSEYMVTFLSDYVWKNIEKMGE